MMGDGMASPEAGAVAGFGKHVCNSKTAAETVLRDEILVELSKQIVSTKRRAGRVVDGSGLENRHT